MHQAVQRVDDENDGTETRYIKEWVQKAALVNLDISFKLLNTGKSSYFELQKELAFEHIPAVILNFFLLCTKSKIVLPILPVIPQSKIFFTLYFYTPNFFNHTKDKNIPKIKIKSTTYL